MRIAHLIMAHKAPKQLQRLVERLKHVNTDIYVHVDGKTPIDDFKTVRESHNIKFISNRKKCNWGGFSFVEAIFNSLREIIQTNHDYSFINLLSAQDYPIKDSMYLYKYLENHKDKNFISYDSNEKSEWWQSASERYEKYHLTDLNIKGKYLIQKILNKLTPRRRFPSDLKLYGSSNSSWWTISGACASYITKQFYDNPELHSFLKYCWGTDEFVIATLIMNSPFKEKVVNNNLRYIDWSEGTAHPKVLLKEDIENISISNMLFARKFDLEIDSEILNALDASHCLH